MKIEEIFVMEHRLKVLEKEIRAVDGSASNFCANKVWHGTFDEPQLGFKRQMCELVGWRADDPLLGSGEVFDLVYRYLYDLLPDCKHGGWLC